MRTKCIISGLILSAVVSLSPAFQAGAAPPSEVDKITKQAATLCENGKFEEAIALQSSAIAKNPSDWLGHAAMSYFLWQQGNVADAVAEGQKAATLAPCNGLVLTNLGHIEQTMENFDGAIPAYQKASKVSPSNWVPWVCLAQSYMRSGRAADGLAVLDKMQAKQDGDFEWYHHLADTYLLFEQPQLAAEVSEKSAAFAKTAEQKSAAANLLMLALLRDNQIDRAKQLRDTVLTEHQPKNFELYVRTAYHLLPVTSPGEGQRLLNAALDNLTEPDDAEGFFRLGRIFQNKAEYVSYDAGKYNAWLDAAKSAYLRAIALGQPLAKHHMALASILARTGDTSAMTEQLTKAAAIETFDPLAPFILSRTKDGKAAELQKARVKMDGLTCGCQLSHFQVGLGKIAGVAFVSTPHEQPYTATLIYDPMMISAPDAFTQCADNIRKTRPDLKLPSVTFTVTSVQPIKHAEDAIRTAQNERFGHVMRFDGQSLQAAPAPTVMLIAERNSQTPQ